jgi:hypothetical protein
MEFVKLLVHSDHERASFAANPEGALSHHGLSNLSPADVHDAVLLVQDTFTVDWSQAYGAGAGAAHTAPVADPAPPDTIGWFLPDEPEPGAGQTVAAEHPMPPGIVDDVLYDAPDLHFGH